MPRSSLPAASPPRGGVRASVQMAADAFDSRKAFVLSSLQSEAPDKSPKGGLDAPCAALVTWLNAQRDVCTTSSCSGRVSLFAHAPGRAKGGAWAYISHERASGDDIAAAFAETLEQQAAACKAGQGAPGDVVLRFEPFILTAECRTRDAGLQARPFRTLRSPP
jgi:tRNA wybutosine-synthesizing protein 3